MRHFQFSRPAAMQTINGNRHTEFTSITQPVRQVKPATAVIEWNRLSVLSSTFDAPVNIKHPNPKKASQRQLSGVISINTGNNKACDQMVASNNHRHCFASADMLVCVPAVKDILASKTTKVNIAMNVIATIGHPYLARWDSLP